MIIVMFLLCVPVLSFFLQRLYNAPPESSKLSAHHLQLISTQSNTKSLDNHLSCNSFFYKFNIDV